MAKRGFFGRRQELLAFMGLICLTSQCLAQALNPLPVATVLDAREFAPYSPIQLSPDGGSVAYTVLRGGVQRTSKLNTPSTRGFPWYGVNAEIYLADGTTGAVRDLTPGADDNFLPRWSPNGRSLAFISNRGGHTGARLWLWDATTDRFQKLSDVAIDADHLAWTPDGRDLIVTTSCSDCGKARVPILGANVGVRVYRSPSPSSPEASGAWNLDEQLRDLVEIDVRTGDAKALVRRTRVAFFLLSPNGSRVVYTAPQRFEKAGSQQILNDIVVVDLAGGHRHNIVSNVRLDYTADSLSWSPDSRRIAFRTGGQDELWNDCYIADVEDGRTQKISEFVANSAESPHRTLQPLWNEEGTEVYFLRNGALWRSSWGQDQAKLVGDVAEQTLVQLISVSDNLLWATDAGRSAIVLAHQPRAGEDTFYKIDLRNGHSTPLRRAAECYTCTFQNTYVAVSATQNRAVYLASDADHETSLWLTQPNFEKPSQLAPLNPDFDKYEMGRVKLIDWLSEDGQSLQGALLLPAGYRPGTLCPLIVFVYAGSYLSKDLHRFGLAPYPLNMQLFATRGYAILLPDSPQQLGTPMLDVAKTVLPGVSKVVEMGIADPEKIGVMGHSNGGYATFALLVQTKRFRAALEIAGMADLFADYCEMTADGSAFGTSMLEHGQDAMGGTPWEFRERYVENSPFFFLDRLETPLLLIQGEQDGTVASFLGDQAFVALRRLGKEAEYVKYAGEDHGPAEWSYSHQMDLCQRMLRWYADHLSDASTSGVKLH